jgi:hypothetical protein
LGITLGIVIAVSGGSHSASIKESALGASASPSASASASAAATTTVTALPIAAPVNARGDVATGANVQDAAGNPFSFNQTPAQAANTMNCTLAVPANPLSATGLATPYQLGDGCSQTQNGATEGAFVEATILSPNGQVQVYNPLVINAGSQPAVKPAPPTIARGSQVILNMGFNGNALALTGQGAFQANCIDALGNSLINQTPSCNAANFYNLANSEIARGALTVPPVGMGTDGQTCQTTTNFALIDQDQSDNVDSTYLVNANNNQVAQDSAANAQNLANNGFAALTNGSDDGLLDAFVDPALGCKPFTATDTTAAGGTSSSEALNVLSARKNAANPLALDPVNDPQLLLAGKLSIQKTNVYRAETDQTPLSTFTNPEQNSATYCQNMVNIQTPRLKGDAALEMNTTSPVPAQGNNLTNFLASRENASFTNLNCQDFGLTNPVTLTLNGAIAIGATYNVNPQTAKVPNAATGTTGTANPPTTGTGGGRPAQHMPGHRGHV